VGVFVRPSAPGPHPALLAFGGSEGGISGGLGFARFYATLGYSCLGVAYFADKNLPPYLAEIPLEYFQTAIDWMKKQPEVKAAAIGVLGGSRGGELALLLAANLPDVKAAIAQVPSGVVWDGYDVTKGVVSSWTFHGKDLPYIPPYDAQPVVKKDAEGHDVK